MQPFHRFALVAGALMLAGCASDGTSLLGSTEPTPPPPASETAEAPPLASAPPPAQSTPARSTTTSKPPARAVEKEKEKKAAKTEKQQPARQAASGEAATAKASSPFNGSWQFSNGQQACMMTLSTSSGSSGSVSASGDCWNAYTKAKGWKLQGNEMVLTDSGNEPIARLQSTGATRYDGYGADGEPVVLVR